MSRQPFREGCFFDFVAAMLDSRALFAGPLVQINSTIFRLLMTALCLALEWIIMAQFG